MKWNGNQSGSGKLWLNISKSWGGEEVKELINKDGVEKR